jgi:hypothetical protein
MSENIHIVNILIQLCLERLGKTMINLSQDMRLEIATAINVKITVFWDVMSICQTT